MNITEINKIVIGLFFIYIVLFSSDIQLILNCELQKLMKNNIYFRHILVFISIYLFVFILKWYNIDSIVVKDEFNDLNSDNIIERLKKNTSYLINSLLLTVVAYIVFIISTKVEIRVFKFVIVMILITMFLQILSKAYDEELHNLIMNNPIIFPEDNKKIILLASQNNIRYDKFIIVLHNMTYLIYIISLLTMIYGVYKYYLKQKKSYGNNWKWSKFIFGIQKCKNVN